MAIESRSPAPLLPLRIFRLRTLAAPTPRWRSSARSRSREFFLLTLYLQDVLRYSAIETGVAFIAFALTVVVVSNVGQVIVSRIGARRR